MTDDRAEFTANRDAGLVKRHEQRLARAQVRDGQCPFCGAEVIPMLEYGKEGPQRLICCRVVPLCGARFDLDGTHIDEGLEETP